MRRMAGQALKEHLTRGFADGVKQGSEDLFWEASGASQRGLRAPPTL